MAVATVASRRRGLCIDRQRRQGDGDGRALRRLQRLEETRHVANLDAFRSAQDARRPVHVPVRAGAGDSLHPAVDRPVQLARRATQVGTGRGADGTDAGTCDGTGRQIAGLSAHQWPKRGLAIPFRLHSMTVGGATSRVVSKAGD
ncbi:hypothetical protein VARIO8X_100140 [Burkholderiales bacterium 8X]|nr:hypothetical protein VARIO8X_100140 [Burkholderiales bacterium 8X]